MTRILLVGCGNMGGALLAGWRDQGAAKHDIVVVDPNPSADRTDLTRYDDPNAVPAEFHPDVVLLAVKPQVILHIVPGYRHYAAQGAVILSIAAGCTLASLTMALGEPSAIVRAMPNMPAAVRRGITVLAANANVTTAQRECCAGLLAAVGEVAWLADESLMDAVTALSGSGPAYIFLLVEAMAAAGEALGLPSGLAQHLARTTVVGAGELLRQAPQSATELRAQVTSPNGTTAAALQILGATPGLADLVRRSVAAAAHRSRQLAEAGVQAVCCTATKDVDGVAPGT